MKDKELCRDATPTIMWPNLQVLVLAISRDGKWVWFSEIAPTFILIQSAILEMVRKSKAINKTTITMSEKEVHKSPEELDSIVIKKIHKAALSLYSAELYQPSNQLWYRSDYRWLFATAKSKLESLFLTAKTAPELISNSHFENIISLLTLTITITELQEVDPPYYILKKLCETKEILISLAQKLFSEKKAEK